jgi:hypothetical protein
MERGRGVHRHMSISIGTNINETHQLDYKYPIFCKNFSLLSIVKNDTQMEDDIVKKSSYNQLKLFPVLNFTQRE